MELFNRQGHLLNNSRKHCSHHCLCQVPPRVVPCHTWWPEFANQTEVINLGKIILEGLNIIQLSCALDTSRDKMRDHVSVRKFFLNTISQDRTFGACWAVGGFLLHQAAQWEMGLQSNSWAQYVPLHVEDLKT